MPLDSESGRSLRKVGVGGTAGDRTVLGTYRHHDDDDDHHDDHDDHDHDHDHDW